MLYSNDLLQELLNYGNTAKAKRIYYKCRKHGKTELAKKIAIKYRLKINTDLADSFAYALINT